MLLYAHFTASITAQMKSKDMPQQKNKNYKYFTYTVCISIHAQ